MARPDGGTEIPIPGLARRLGRGIRYAFTGNADWFGPGQPVPPTAPEAVAGRQFQMPISYNTLIQTKVEGVSFGQLRMLADTCDIIRLLIEIRKDQICSLDWSIQKRVLDSRQGRHSVKRDNISDSLVEFFNRPDKDHEWEDWLRLVLEDMFVVDAASLYVQRTRGGGVYALRPLDGATIKRIIDPHGWTPEPPNVAYQQILQGTPAIDYTTRELLYRPRNPRTNHIYGYSHVEQVIVTARTWLARQASNLEYYDKGSVPDGFLSASKDWGAQQIAEYQELFDLQLSGQLGERRKIKITPNDSKFVQTKEPALKDPYDEWLARIACFCFSVPPTAFVNEMNRATAGTVNIASLETGMGPARKWVERLMNHVIHDVLEKPDYEFTFRDREAQDPLERAQIDAIYLANGVLLPDEVRGDLGLLPLPPQPTPVAANGVPKGGSQPRKDGATDAQPPRTLPQVGKPVAHKHDHGELAKAETQKEKRIAGVFLTTLAEVRDAVVKQWKARFAHVPVTQAAAMDFAEKADLSAFSLAWDDYSGELVATASDGAKAAIMRARASNPDMAALLNHRDPEAIKWASEHAAEMIKSDGSGGQLLDSTRNMIRETLAKGIADKLSSDEVAQQLQDAYAFSPERADLIAVTEIRNAEGNGLLVGYKSAGLQYKKWLLSNDEGICPLCEANAAQGYIPIDEAFVSGAQAPLQHPNCRCDLAATSSKPGE